MRRREFIAGLGAALAAPRALAQEKRLAVVGVVSGSRPPSAGAFDRNPAFRKLRELGWREGQTMRIKAAFGRGSEDDLPALAAELVRRRPDVIWTIGPRAAVEAARATSSIPIVFWGVSWPVEQGLVESLRRPGRNVTGVAFVAAAEVYAKLVEFLRELAPKAERLAEIVVTGQNLKVSGGETPGSAPQVEATARGLGFKLHRYTVSRGADFASALEAMDRDRVQALLCPTNLLTYDERERIVGYASSRRLPSAFASDEFTEAGGLISYGLRSTETYVASAHYVDKILRGARPAELPVDLPKEIEFVLNLKTARAIGVRIPKLMRMRADFVIE